MSNNEKTEHKRWYIFLLIVSKKLSIHNHFVLPMSLFIDLMFYLPNRGASSEQFSAVMPLQLQKINEKKITAEDR